MAILHLWVPGGQLPLAVVRICWDGEGLFLAHFSAIYGRVFKQYATKGRVFDIQKCAREGMVIPLLVPEGV